MFKVFFFELLNLNIDKFIDDFFEVVKKFEEEYEEFSKEKEDR